MATTRNVKVGGRRTGSGLIGPPQTKSGSKKLTGRANATTRGQGKKKGLRKQGY